MGDQALLRISSGAGRRLSQNGQTVFDQFSYGARSYGTTKLRSAVPLTGSTYVGLDSHGQPVFESQSFISGSVFSSRESHEGYLSQNITSPKGSLAFGFPSYRSVLEKGKLAFGSLSHDVRLGVQGVWDVPANDGDLEVSVPTTTVRNPSPQFVASLLAAVVALAHSKERKGAVSCMQAPPPEEPPVFSFNRRNGEQTLVNLSPEEIGSTIETVISLSTDNGAPTLEAPDPALTAMREEHRTRPGVEAVCAWFSGFGDSLMECREEIRTTGSFEELFSLFKTSLLTAQAAQMGAVAKLFKRMWTLLQIQPGPVVAAPFAPQGTPIQNLAQGTHADISSAVIALALSDAQRNKDTQEKTIGELLREVGASSDPKAIKDIDRNASVPVHPEHASFTKHDVLPKAIISVVVQKHDKHFPFSAFPKPEDTFPVVCVLECHQQLIMQHPANEGPFQVDWLKFYSRFWVTSLRRFLTIFTFVFNKANDPNSGQAIFSLATVKAYEQVLVDLMDIEPFAYVKSYDLAVRKKAYDMIPSYYVEDSCPTTPFNEAILPLFRHLHQPTIDALNMDRKLEAMVEERYARGTKRTHGGEAVVPTKEKTPGGVATKPTKPPRQPKATPTTPPATAIAPVVQPRAQGTKTVSGGPKYGIPFVLGGTGVKGPDGVWIPKKWVDLSSPEMGGTGKGPRLDPEGVPTHHTTHHAAQLCQPNHDIPGGTHGPEGGVQAKGKGKGRKWNKLVVDPKAAPPADGADKPGG